MAGQKNTLAIAIALLALAVLIAAASWFVTSNNKPDSNASGAASALYTEGVHFQSIKSPLAFSATQTPDDKISVVEFFWYGCPHCQAFEPSVRKWLASAAEDVAFRQVPVVWNEATSLHAALFYVAEDAETVDPLHDKLFEKIITLRPEKNLDSQLEQLAAVYADHGIDESTVKRLVESGQIKARVADSKNLMRKAEVSSTPTVLVAGKWAVLNNNEVGEAGTFNVVDFLVEKARAAK